VASLVAGFGVVDLVTALAPGPEWESLRMLEAGWGIVFGIVIPIALAAQTRRGGGPVAAVQQLVVLTASLALATLLTTRTREWLLVLALAASTAVVAAVHPARSRVFAAGGTTDRVLAALATLAVVPAAIYAERVAANRRAGVLGDNTLGFEHWTVQSALPICLVLLVALGGRGDRLGLARRAGRYQAAVASSCLRLIEARRQGGARERAERRELDQELQGQARGAQHRRPSSRGRGPHACGRYDR
jgi:hypothetical protein